MLRRPVESAQYVSLIIVGQRLRKAGIAQSMGSKGDCYDNAVCESFHATLEKSSCAGARSAPSSRRGPRSSTGSRPGTTASGVTPGSATARLPSTNTTTTKEVTARGRTTERISLKKEQELPNVYVSTEPGAVHRGSDAPGMPRERVRGTSRCPSIFGRCRSGCPGIQLDLAGPLRRRRVRPNLDSRVTDRAEGSP